MCFFLYSLAILYFLIIIRSCLSSLEAILCFRCCCDLREGTSGVIYGLWLPKRRGSEIFSTTTNSKCFRLNFESAQDFAGVVTLVCVCFTGLSTFLPFRSSTTPDTNHRDRTGADHPLRGADRASILPSLCVTQRYRPFLILLGVTLNHELCRSTWFDSIRSRLHLFTESRPITCTANGIDQPLCRGQSASSIHHESTAVW